jgi:hypothetical protein
MEMTYAQGFSVTIQKSPALYLRTIQSLAIFCGHFKARSEIRPLVGEFLPETAAQIDSLISYLFGCPFDTFRLAVTVLIV